MSNSNKKNNYNRTRIVQIQNETGRQREVLFNPSNCLKSDYTAPDKHFYNPLEKAPLRLPSF
jgi:hypothetical protein